MTDEIQKLTNRLARAKERLDYLKADWHDVPHDENRMRRFLEFQKTYQAMETRLQDLIVSEAISSAE